MRPKKTRKHPISTVNPGRVVSHKVTQATISSFHTLLKRQSRLQQQLASCSPSDDRAGLDKQLADILNAIAALGGLDAYQKASTLGQSVERGGDSSKVLVSWLKELVPPTPSQKGKEKAKPLRMLEIGALTPSNYASCSTWIDNHPIDLNAQHADIVQQDFLLRPLPQTDDERFDIISCSLVLNFVSNVADRGRMLSLAHSQLRPAPSSFLFLVLPLPCITNSRYMSLSSLQCLMACIGFELVKERWKPGGKVGYWLYRWKEVDLGIDTADERERWRKKTIENEGPKRNNFAIVLS
ncbi:25S rRNA (adenine2142-N1)-methyltransferase, partial [Tremellales sp. Uapishka_1]